MEGEDAMVMTRVAFVWFVTFAVLVVPVALSTQAQSAQDARFEVASVRPNISGDGGGGINLQPGGRFTALNVPLVWLIESAYGLGHHQLEGGPSWIHTERFDVVAKAESDIPRPVLGSPPGAFHFMLRALLAERFKLVVREEKREAPVYELEFARTGDALGPGLRRIDFDCTTAEKTSDGRIVDRNGRRTCGSNIAARAIPLSQLITVIEGQLERPVVDRINLSGLFDVDLEWSADSADTSKASLFTALQEQLGLKLVAARGEVNALIVERAERPTPD
jgi:uncharacterized protein (TIGR03435 family)